MKSLLLRLAAHSSRLSASDSRLLSPWFSIPRFLIPDSRLLSPLFSIPRFVIPDSRFCMPKAILLLMVMLLVTITFPLHASTPGFDTLVNYDTAWTFVYDGGKKTDGTPVTDIFYDVKVISDGTSILAGASGDTIHSTQSLLVELDKKGKVLQNKLYITNNTTHSYYNEQSARSIVVAKNGDFIIGGERWGAPYVMRLDPLGNIKWATWYYLTYAPKVHKTLCFKIRDIDI